MLHLDKRHGFDAVALSTALRHHLIRPTSTRRASSAFRPAAPRVVGSAVTAWVNRARRRGVVASGELHEDARLAADGPGIVTGRQQHHLVRAELVLATVVHHDVQAPR